MKTILALGFAFMFLFMNGKSITRPNKNVKKITIRCTKLNMLTEYRISCNGFESDFSGKIKQFDFTKKEDISKVVNVLSKAKAAQADTEDLDVRAKVSILYEDKKTDSLCLDAFGKVYTKNQMWDLPDNNYLVKMIDSLYYTK